MERTWFWRLGLVLAVLFWSLWQLVPTWAYFRLPPAERNGPAFEQSVPRWAPDARKHLNLGLDLQGGIIGKVFQVEDKTVTLDLGGGNKVRIVKGQVAGSWSDATGASEKDAKEKK